MRCGEADKSFRQSYLYCFGGDNERTVNVEWRDGAITYLEKFILSREVVKVKKCGYRVCGMGRWKMEMENLCWRKMETEWWWQEKIYCRHLFTGSFDSIRFCAFLSAVATVATIA